MDPLLYRISCGHHLSGPRDPMTVWAPADAWWLSGAALPLAAIPAGWLEAAGQTLGPLISKIIGLVSFLHLCSLAGTPK